MGYYVHVPGNGEPTLEHDDYATAVQEAQRLCLKHKRNVRIYDHIADVEFEPNAVVVPLHKAPEVSKYKVHDKVLYTNHAGYHVLGTVVSIGDDGLLEVMDKNSTVQVVMSEDIVRKVS